MLRVPVEGLRRVGKDLRWSVRMLSRHRRFAVLATLPLILGVGVNTAIFTIFNASVLRPLAVPEPDRVVRLYEDSSDAARRKMFSFREYADYRDRNTVFSDLAGYADAGLLLRGPDLSARAPGAMVSDAVGGAYVSGNYFRLLSGRLAMGRWLAVEPGDEDLHSAVISDRLWKRRFASAPEVLGQLVELNGVQVAIVGVTAPEFIGAEPSPPDVFLSLGAAVLMERRPAWLTDEATPGLRLIGRLRPAATVEQAEAVMSVLAQQRATAAAPPRTSVRIAAVRASFLTMEPEILAGTGVILFVTGLVLFTACANVATLLLVRASVRGREIAIRLAIGASRTDLVRMLLTESLTVAVASSAIALLLSTWTLKVLIATAIDARTLPESFALNMTPDFRVLSYTSLVAVVTAVVCGLAPALRASRRDLVPALNDNGAAMGSAGNSRWMNVLVAGQIAVSFMLLAGCGLLIRSEWKSHRADVGFETEHTADLYLDLAAAGYDEARALDAVTSLRDRARNAPGVAGVTLAARPPLSNSFLAQVSTDAAAQPVLAGYNLVDSDFLPTLRIPILRGHNVAAQVGADVPEVVISESLANALWPSADPLGRRVDLRLVSSPSLARRSPVKMAVIVGGVARDTQRAKLLLDATPYYIYMPLTGGWTPLQTAVVIRTSGQGETATAILNAESRALNISTPIASRRLSDVLRERRRPVAIAAVLAAVFGALALLIAVVGEYGLVSYSVSQRTREIGVRVALGAQPRTVVGFVLRQGALVIGTGVATGCLISGVAGVALAKFLFQVSPFDLITYAVVAGVFLITGLLAVAAPTYKAVAIDPVLALRQRT
jgi:predicted permease